MKVGVLYSASDKFGNTEVEQDLKEMANAAYAALEKGGYSPQLVDIGKYGLDGLEKEGFDALFNVCERLDGDPSKESFVASSLEEMGATFTGSPGSVIDICNDKPEVKRIANEHGIRTPRFLVFDGKSPFDSSSFPFPAIVKPSAMHNSIGIWKDAVVRSSEAAEKRAMRIIKKFKQPALIEEFIPGKDIEITLLGNGDSTTVLTPMEVFYPKMKVGRPMIYSYECKWFKRSEGYGDYRPVKGVPKKAVDEMVSIAKRCFHVFGLRDYGRLREDGTPYVIEVTANPGISKECSTIQAAKLMGIGHADVLLSIFNKAVKRCLAPEVTASPSL